jgi:hypothetical protein
MEALRQVAEPLCQKMVNGKQADDTRKKLQALEGDLKQGAVNQDMRTLIAALLRNLGAGDRQEAEKTQRSIAQLAFDAGENSPPWVQATSRLVLQLKAGLGGSSNPGTPKSAAGAAGLLLLPCLSSLLLSPLLSSPLLSSPLLSSLLSSPLLSSPLLSSPLSLLLSYSLSETPSRKNKEHT